MNFDTIRGVLARSGPGRWLRARRFKSSAKYWEQRYAAGGTSGQGSYGGAAQWKARVANNWVKKYGMTSVVDLGCGDGNQLALAEYPRYLGLDRSRTAVIKCIDRFHDDADKSFLCFDPDAISDPGGWLRADVAVSLEVIFHLTEDHVREDYLRRLFASADRFVIICSSNRSDILQAPHERHEAFTPWVDANAIEWSQIECVTPPSEVNIVSAMFLYRRVSPTTSSNRS